MQMQFGDTSGSLLTMPMNAGAPYMFSLHLGFTLAALKAFPGCCQCQTFE